MNRARLKETIDPVYPASGERKYKELQQVVSALFEAGYKVRIKVKARKW